MEKAKIVRSIDKNIEKMLADLKPDRRYRRVRRDSMRTCSSRNWEPASNIRSCNSVEHQLLI